MGKRMIGTNMAKRRKGGVSKKKRSKTSKNRFERLFERQSEEEKRHIAELVFGN